MKKVLIVSLMGFSVIAQGNYCSEYIPVQPYGNAFVVPQKNPALTVLEQQARDKIKAIQNESSDSVRMTLQEELRSIQRIKKLPNTYHFSHINCCLWNYSVGFLCLTGL